MIDTTLSTTHLSW